MRLACEARGAVARRFREEASRQEDVEEARRQGRARAAGGQTRTAPRRAGQGQGDASEEEARAGQEGRREEGSAAQGSGQEGGAAEEVRARQGQGRSGRDQDKAAGGEVAEPGAEAGRRQAAGERANGTGS